MTTKLQAVEMAEKASKEGAARQFRVGPRRIRERCTQKDALEKTKKHRGTKQRRLDGGGRKIKDEDMEKTLLDWILELRGRNVRVS